MSYGAPSAKRARKELVPLETNVSVVGVGGYFVCEVRASTVKELKQEIEKVNGVSAIRQQIFHGEKQLHDRTQLS